MVITISFNHMKMEHFIALEPPTPIKNDKNFLLVAEPWFSSPTSSAMTFNSRRHDVTSINITSANPEVCLVSASLDYVSHVGKCLYWLMKTVAR